MHEIIFKKARGLPQITKRITMCIFMHRCAGLRVDRGTQSAYVQTEKDFLVHMCMMCNCGLINLRTPVTRL
jgi:hypothetical protein